MSQEENELNDRELTIPLEPAGPKQGFRQLSVRMHPHDHTMMMTLLKRDKMTFQKFYGYMINGYLNADPRVLSFIREMRELETVPDGMKEKHVLSLRERNNIFNELEKEREKDKNVK